MATKNYINKKDLVKVSFLRMQLTGIVTKVEDETFSLGTMLGEIEIEYPKIITKINVGNESGENKEILQALHRKLEQDYSNSFQ